MSRITQDLAGQIAYKLTEKSRAAAELLKKDYQQMTTDYYDQETPKEVAEVKAKHPDWFCTTRTIRLEGHGFRYETVTATHPVIKNKDHDAYLTLTPKIASALTTAKRNWEKADAACKELKKETEHALINLRTYKNISENIPEAKAYLPPPMSNALVVNVDSLNRKLAKQPEVKLQTK